MIKSQEAYFFNLKSVDRSIHAVVSAMVYIRQLSIKTSLLCENRVRDNQFSILINIKKANTLKNEFQEVSFCFIIKLHLYKYINIKLFF